MPISAGLREDIAVYRGFIGQQYFNMYAFKRFYLGFYPDAKDVHKRPLTLLKQSIAKEMGLE